MCHTCLLCKFDLWHVVVTRFCLRVASFQPRSEPEVVVAEWLRRWTRNPLGSPRAGSNPADNVSVFSLRVIARLLTTKLVESLKNIAHASFSE